MSAISFRAQCNKRSNTVTPPQTLDGTHDSMQNIYSYKVTMVYHGDEFIGFFGKRILVDSGSDVSRPRTGNI